jgi:hypothetical protein
MLEQSKNANREMRKQDKQQIDGHGEWVAIFGTQRLCKDRFGIRKCIQEKI